MGESNLRHLQQRRNGSNLFCGASMRAEGPWGRFHFCPAERFISSGIYWDRSRFAAAVPAQLPLFRGNRGHGYGTQGRGQGSARAGAGRHGRRGVRAPPGRRGCRRELRRNHLQRRPAPPAPGSAARHRARTRQGGDRAGEPHGARARDRRRARALRRAGSHRGERHARRIAVRRLRAHGVREWCRRHRGGRGAGPGSARAGAGLAEGRARADRFRGPRRLAHRAQVAAPRARAGRDRRRASPLCRRPPGRDAAGGRERRALRFRPRVSRDPQGPARLPASTPIASRSSPPAASTRRSARARRSTRGRTRSRSARPSR